MVVRTPTPTVLLVALDHRIVGLLESVKAVVTNLHLEICRNYAEAPLRIKQMEVALVVIHVARGTNQEEVRHLLHAVCDLEQAVACILLMEECDEGKKTAFLRAGAACCLPPTVTLRKLAHTVETLTFLARGLDVEPVECAEPDPDRNIADADPSFYMSIDMAPMMEQVRNVVAKNTTILFTGETGTGKTRLARLIHEMSPRRHEPFLIVDCNSLAPTLIESELFGHAKGAFTGADRVHDGKFAMAGNGTLVLDEINSLPLSLQTKLLRVVDDRVFYPVGSSKPLSLQARLITVSNARLEQEVAEGRFRPDLFYRLNVCGYHLPRLRDRVGAIAPLARQFLAIFAAKNHPAKTGISADALGVLEKYHWPGNIRELSNVIERAVTSFPGSMVEVSHLPEALRANDFHHADLVRSPRDSGSGPATLSLHNPAVASEDLTLLKTKEKAEILRITEALQKHRNNRLRTAAELGISRMALYKKLDKYGLHHAV